MHYTIVDYLVDIFQNAIEADSKHNLVSIVRQKQMLAVTVADNGRGMAQAQLDRALDPFYSDGVKHQKRKVGLGLPFLLQNIQTTGGKFDIQSQEGNGTTLFFQFDLSHIDTPPLGSLPRAIRTLFIFPGDYQLILTRREGDSEYRLDRHELLETLDGDLASVASLGLLLQFIESQEQELLT